jgi:hypothetical protein
MYESAIVLHLVGASATACVGAFALVALWNHFDDRYSFVANVLGALAGFEILTGTMLAVLSPQVSASSLCSRVFLYLFLVVIIETLLFARMRKISMASPMTTVFAPVIAGFATFLSAMVYGL